jgi:hypothetical protein
VRPREVVKKVRKIAMPHICISPRSFIKSEIKKKPFSIDSV